MKEYHVLNLGAGVQSTALYLLSREPHLPCGRPVSFKFDVAIFADTQEEPKAVYDHLAYLQSLGNPPIWIRTRGILGDDLIKGQNSSGGRFASIPAFTAEDHRTRLRFCAGTKFGMLRRQCTKEYKIEVCERAIKRELVGLKPRQRMPKDVIVYQYFGITTDEAKRAERAKKRFGEVKWSKPVYPFLDMEWSRQDCIKYLKVKLPHPVPKSACVFCPYRDNNAWERLKNTDSEGWKRAVQIDNALRIPGNVVNRNMQQSLYLHRSCIPLEQVDFGERKHDMPGGLSNECEGMCGV